MLFCARVCFLRLVLGDCSIRIFKNFTAIPIMNPLSWFMILFDTDYYLIQNSQAVKKECAPQKGYGEKRCEIQGGSQEMAVMVG